MQNMKPYVHRVQYYETDRMGMTHHSNYIRWMEEARIDLMAQLGWPYEKLEEEGVISPVTAIDCRFKASTTFPDEISIEVSVLELKSAVLKIGYRMSDGSGKTVFEGSSEHCFLNGEGKIVRLKKECPGLYDALSSMIEERE